MKNIHEFLSAFHGDSKIHFRVIKKGASNNLYGTYDELSDRLNKYNQEGYDIYFVVNSGGTHNHEINKINAVYVDFDCGKDENKNYYSLEETHKFKNKCLARIHEFKYKPSYIVETRNGVHVYWIIENGTTEQFELCQLQLIQYFESDPAVKTVERIMRVPFFYWTKDIENKYMSNILESNNVKYSIDDIINNLPMVKVEKRNSVTRKSTDDNVPKQTVTTYRNNVIQIKEGLTRYNGAEVLQKIIMANRIKLNIINQNKDDNTVVTEGGGFVTHDKNNTNITVSSIGHKNPYLMDEIKFSSHVEVYDYLKKQDLNEFLGIDENKFCCFFHNDQSPSASIFQDPSTGYWWYKCWSPDCSLNKNVSKFSNEKKSIVDIRAKDIIAITERLLKCNRIKALRFLRKVYNIQYFETEWQKEQKEMLDENIRMLTINFEEFETAYPNLYRRIKQSKNDLVEMNLFAKEFVFTENFTDSNDNSVFFASIDKICKMFNLHQSSTKNVVRKLSVFSFLGIINKLTENDIPKTYLNTAKHFAAKNKQVNIIGFYSIPSYSDEILSYAEEMAVLFKEKNMSARAFSREILVRTFDEDFANKIFPQTSKRKLTQKSIIRTEQIHRVALNLIEQYGYVIETEIIKIMAETYEEEGRKYSANQFQIQIKKSLQEMLDTYGLERIRCNNKIKDAYGVVSDGYPFIIVRKEKE